MAITLAHEIHARTRPRHRAFHLFEQAGHDRAFDVESGRIVDLPATHAETLRAALQIGDSVRTELLARMLRLGLADEAPIEAPQDVPLKALSLSVAQKCNLGCTYCYAQQGSFGGAAREMETQVALESVDYLLRDAKSGEKFTLAFMGGEPLANRKTLHAAARHAAGQAATRGLGIGFTLTTNATLLREEDLRLFQDLGFTVTVSIDGLGEANDALRPFKNGKGSFGRVADNIRLLLDHPQRKFQVNARATITPKNLALRETLMGLSGMGFDSVAFSPMLSSPTGREELEADDFDRLLEGMIACGEVFRHELGKGRILPFANILKILKTLHGRQRNVYPCGAGGGYMSVSADGGLYACHRFVNDESGYMGDVKNGIEQKGRSAWLKSRQLYNQPECGQCWARYLCSGSCHYEAMKRGRPACDYIRGWLDYCIKLYAELYTLNPGALRALLNDNGGHGQLS